MADIRINSLPTTASASSSDDFLALDGATNGTRKLNAYSPTFGGNLTVSGTGTSSVAGPWKIKPATNTSQLILEQNNATANWNIFCDSTTGGLSFIRNTSGTTYFSIIASSNATIGIDTTISGDLLVNNVKPAAGYSVDWGFGTSIKRVIADGRLQLNSQNGAYEFTGTGAATFAGNLTVSGGTITSGSGTLTLNSSANTVVLQSAGTTALTLDSSQNATFAGIIKTGNGGQSVSGDVQVLKAAGATGQVTLSQVARGTWYLQNPAIGALPAGFNITSDVAGPITMGNSGGTYFTLGTTGDATFAGTITQTQAASGSTANLKLGELGIREWGFYATGGKMSIRPSSIGTWSFNGNTDVELLRTTASTTTGTGALQVAGGVGVAGAANVGTYYGMVDGVTAPAATSGYAKIYVDTADGDLKVIFGDGTIKTIATDT